MSLEQSIIPPGSAIGVLGSGQLGRMFAIAARRMGYRVHTFSPDDDTPTGQVADVEIRAAYDDLAAIEQFARGVKAVTFEFENVPAAAAEVVARHVPVRPGGHVLHVTQHRLREKEFLASHGLPVAPFRAVRTAEQLTQAVAELGTPAVLKTAHWGYDGKGQARINSPEEALSAWQSIGQSEAVLEAFIHFDSEASVVAARAADGSYADFGVVANHHERHILDLTIAPAPLGIKLQSRATEIAREVLTRLDVVGVLCVEFFVRGDELLVNELAPRPHNSGHFTFDASLTSQFEQQVRAACGWGLGSTELLRPAAMANLLGDLWTGGEPRWDRLRDFPQVKLHLYGKAEPRVGRKMGHLTALANSPDEAATLALAARRALLPD